MTGTIRTELEKPLLWGLFILYLVIAGYTMMHHELWGDEVHSWNIAKGSVAYIDLLRNIRYEGHPPLWYTILWTISKFTHDVAYVQLVHIIIASLVVFLVLFFSPFPFLTKALIPFGYFFLYEYAVLSRNYAIGLLMIFLISVIIRKTFSGKLLLYYALLLLLSNMHILGIIMAGSFHLYFLLFTWEQRSKWKPIAAHMVAGALVLLPAIYMVFPPSDGTLIVNFWTDRWTYRQVVITVQSPLRAFVPVPAWWNFNSWNTQFLMELQQQHRWMRFGTPLLATGIAALCAWALRKNKKCLAMFGANLVVTFLFSAILFALATIRYTGFLYIAFIAAWWLYCYEMAPGRIHNRIVNVLLVVQLLAGVFFVVRDLRYPFSNFYQVSDLLKEVPPQEKVGTDYWALNAAAAYTDSGLYCIDMQKHLNFISWDSDYKIMAAIPNRYYSGVKKVFGDEGIHSLYMISSASPAILFSMDPKLADSFRVQLTDQREGAIEKGSNLYLYHITTAP